MARHYLRFEAFRCRDCNCITDMPHIGELFGRRTLFTRRSVSRVRGWTCPRCQRTLSSTFSTSTRLSQEQQRGGGPFRTKLRVALRNTKVQWKPIPIGLGIGFLGAFQFYRVRERQKTQQQEDNALEGSGGKEEHAGRPKKRERIRPSGPW